MIYFSKNRERKPKCCFFFLRVSLSDGCGQPLKTRIFAAKSASGDFRAILSAQKFGNFLTFLQKNKNLQKSNKNHLFKPIMTRNS
jgi:hypothetical protein